MNCYKIDYFCYTEGRTVSDNILVLDYDFFLAVLQAREILTGMFGAPTGFYVNKAEDCGPVHERKDSP